MPIALIADRVRDWIDLGWRFGSYFDEYAEDDVEDDSHGERDTLIGAAAPDKGDKVDDRKARMAADKRIIKALIRHMAETYDNEVDAYAMDKTGHHFTKTQVREAKRDDIAVRKFRNASREFEAMSFEQQQEWRKRVGRYPELEALVMAARDLRA